MFFIVSDRRRRRSIPQNGRPSAGATATRRWRAALAAGTDRTNKEFEQRALEAELGRRRVKVSISVRTTEDWGEDEVYVKLVGAGGRKVVSATSP